MASMPTNPQQQGPDSSDAPGPDEEPPRFTPEEEAALVADSAALKAEANALFASGDYAAAIAKYTDALGCCPAYLPAPRAVLHCNAAACHLKLRAWADAVREAGQALERLDERVDQAGRKEGEEDGREDRMSHDVKVETDRCPEDNKKNRHSAAEDGPATTAEPPSRPPIPPRRQQTQPSPSAAPPEPQHQHLQEPKPRPSPLDEPALVPIRVKTLMRRAAARAELGGWQELVGAEEDYRLLAAYPDGAVRPLDREVVRRQLRELAPRVAAAQKREVDEMWGKLKELGNGILRPFGMSTDNFQMAKDERTGGYSMNFRPDDTA